MLLAVWHRRLAHSSIRNIQESIPHTNGIEELLNRKHTEHLKCPACMIGKATLEDYPSRKASATKPLRLVNVDSFSSSVVSMEGFVHAVVIVDSSPGYQWLYGMKTKDGMLTVFVESSAAKQYQDPGLRVAIGQLTTWQRTIKDLIYQQMRYYASVLTVFFTSHWVFRPALSSYPPFPRPPPCPCLLLLLPPLQRLHPTLKVSFASIELE